MMEIIKNKEEVKSVMNIIQAFANGKTIQAIDPYDDEWCNQTKLNFEALFEGQYRIKPEPKYRPFNSAEECWQEMLKHHSFFFFFTDSGYEPLWHVNKGDDFNATFKDSTFADGTPYGIKEEE